MKRITLTFDNGPHEVGTPQILDLLARRQLKATFFLVADRLRQPALRALAARIHAEGHCIGNHTLTHSVALGRTAGPEAVQAEIGQAQELVAAFGAEKLFRPNGDRGQLGPHLLSEDAVEYLEANRFTAVTWNCVPVDWVGPEGAWLQRAMDAMQGQDWTVLVLHDHCQVGAMRYLEQLLDHLCAQGYEFSFDFPSEVILIDAGRRTPALAGNYTPRAAAA